MVIKGFKVKSGDMTEALCNAKGNGIKYSDAGIPNLIVKLNPSLNPNETSVHIACEVGGEAHGAALLDKLHAGGFEVELE